MRREWCTLTEDKERVKDDLEIVAIQKRWTQGRATIAMSPSRQPGEPQFYFKLDSQIYGTSAADRAAVVDAATHELGMWVIII